MKIIKLLVLVFFLFYSWTGRSQSYPLQITWSTTDYHVSRESFPFKLEDTGNKKIVAWRGDRISLKILVGSNFNDSEISFVVKEPEGCSWIDASTTGFLDYVMTDELNKEKTGGCGYRPDKTLFDSSLVADRIVPMEKIKYQSKTVLPIWITLEVPNDTETGVYQGSVEIRNNGSLCKVLPYSVRVLNRNLSTQSKQKFHLDLWQNPFAVARYAGVAVWSKEHFEVMRPLMERLAKAGQKGITTSITHKPWNAQTYDYFENMITEIKRIDGSWSYDFTIFDQWVEFMQSCGVGPYIYCYSVIPWNLTFRYYDQRTNSMVDKKLDVKNPEFYNYWENKLKAFASHLKSKGWFQNTIIAMDERPKESMEAALRVIRNADPEYKISLAGVYHSELNKDIHDYSIPYNDKYPDGVIEERRESGQITTFYTCCSEPFPNTFTFSQPIEGAIFGPVAAERHLDGYLRWAYNSWVQYPNKDSRFHTWAAGDTFLVYPNNISSVRFEKIIEGIQLYEKICILSSNSSRRIQLQEILKSFAHGKITADSAKKAMHRLRNHVNRD